MMTTDQINRQLIRRAKRIKLALEEARDLGSNMVKTEEIRLDVDAIFCYQNGYINKYNKIKFDAAIGKEWVSAGFTPDKKFRKEHVIPVRVIAEKLFSLGEDVMVEEIIKVVLENYQLAHILLEEDALLNDKNAPYGNLQYRMPEEYYDSKSPLYMDPLARYKVAGIQIFKK